MASNKIKGGNTREMALGILWGLTLEFVLGMILNLFTEPPEEGKLYPLWMSVLYAAHAVIGLLLLVGATILVIKSRHSMDEAWKKSAMWGFVSILVAAVSGMVMTQLGESVWEKVASLLMALASLAAFISYGRYFLLKKD